MPKGHLPVKSYLAVPVIARPGVVLGALIFGHSQAGVFTEKTERLIVGVAAQAGIAVDNARLYNDVKRAEQEKTQLLSSERAAREESERMNRMKDEFLATLSHELRTPLNAILGWSQFLLGEDCEAEDLETGLETIARNARAQTQLIEDLLDMSRIISGKVRLDVQAVDLTSVVDAAIASMKPAADAKGIDLRKSFASNALPISGDPNRLQQIVWNLLSNAVKFTPSSGRIEVKLELVKTQVQIHVIDSGAGITADFLPHVFERFRQADSSLTRKHGGLGLGLAIVKQLAELHGGTVSVTSPGVEAGSRFTLSLPLTQPGDQTAKGLSEPSLLTSKRFIRIDLSGIKVLVVDDDQDARDLIKRALSLCQAEVLSAAGADEAIVLLKSSKPDVLLSDIGMPGKDGFQLIAELRGLSEEEGGRIPAVAVTAFVRSEDRVKALKAGFQHHIAKPIEPSELVNLIASLAARNTRG